MAQKSPIAKITAKKNDLRFVKKGSLFGGEDYFFVILRLKWLLCLQEWRHIGASKGNEV